MASGNVHEVGKQTALGRACIFHANHHGGEHPFKDTRWCEVIGGANFFQVDIDRGRGLGAIHHIATTQPLRVAENILPNPGRRHIGQDFFFFA